MLPWKEEKEWSSADLASRARDMKLPGDVSKEASFFDNRNGARTFSAIKVACMHESWRAAKYLYKKGANTSELSTEEMISAGILPQKKPPEEV